MNKKNIGAVIWALLVSLAWLIPNHYQPWTSFHSDAWVALIGALTFLLLVFGRKKTLTWPLFAIVTFSLCFVPWIHYATGLLVFVSQAWMTSAYLLGFSLAIVVGANLEKRMPGVLPDALLGAMVFASIVSVGLSLGSWAEVLETGLNDYLSMGYSGGRHYANLGQPNMLASLLLWGVIGCFWAYSKKIINIQIVLVASAFLVLGIVLTKSRMAYVVGFVILSIVLIYERSIKLEKIKFISLILLAVFFLGVYFFQWMDVYFFQREGGAEYVRSALQGDVRLTAWELFLDAIWNRPWFGYGWTEVINAQIAVAHKFPSMGGMFGHTHNILLDIFVWLGIPLASLVVIFLVVWFGHVLKNIKNEQDLLLLLLLIVVGVHSMFEYPLQYATFLIPTGMVVGVIGVRVAMSFSVEINKSIVIGLILASTFLLFGLVRDYLRVEESYNKWRFERAGLVYPMASVPNVPDVIYLTQFKYWLEMVRIRPHTGMTQVELALREDVVRAYPSPGAIYELALAYALNGHPDNAIFWLNRLCKLANDLECAALKSAWNVQRDSNSLVEKILWSVE